METVTLAQHELMMAAPVGVRRHVEALERGLTDRHGAESEPPWQIHIEGACGECATAKCLGIYWDGSTGTFKMRGDVGALEVRTRSEHWHDLIVRPKDKSNAIYVLVTGTAPTYFVRGWLFGHHCKVSAFWKDKKNAPGGRDPGWFVPSSALLPMEELRRLLAHKHTVC